MPEVAHASGDEHHAVLVAAGDRVAVPKGAAWVRDGSHARRARLLHRVAPGEGEEGVAGQHRALQSTASVALSRSVMCAGTAVHRGARLCI